MAGGIQILVAVFRLGDLTRYISESVVIGFMAGAGFLIALTQVGNLLGLKEQGTGDQHILWRLWLTLTAGRQPSTCGPWRSAWERPCSWCCCGRSRDSYHLPRFDMLLALGIAATAAATLGWSQAGGEPSRRSPSSMKSGPGFPPSTLPQFRLDWIREMSGSALAVACLGLLEALSIAKAISHQTRQPLDYNRQCLAEGLANLCGGFFQCLPGSGSLTRSAINYQAGAVTRWSGVFAAGAVALVVWLFGPLAKFIPKAALAGILLVTAAGLIDQRRIRHAVRASRFDALLVLATALSAVLIGVEFSILIGVGLSILMFVPRAARLKAAELTISTDRVIRDRQPTDPCCTRMVLLDLEGEFFFGAAPELDRYFDRSPRAFGSARHRAAGQADAESGHCLHGAAPALHRRDAGQGGDGLAVRRAARLRPGDAEPAFPGFPPGRSCFHGRCRAVGFSDPGCRPPCLRSAGGRPLRTLPAPHPAGAGQRGILLSDLILSGTSHLRHSPLIRSDQFALGQHVVANLGQEPLLSTPGGKLPACRAHRS